MRFIGITLDKYDNRKAKKIIQLVLEGLSKNNLEIMTIDIDEMNKFKINNVTDIFIIYGIMRGSDVAIKYCNDNKLKYLYMDNCYFNTITNVHRYRIVPNACHPSKKLLNIKKPHFPINFEKEKNNDDGYILIIPPSNTVRLLFDKQKWLTNTKNELLKNTKREIIVRTKPVTNSVKMIDGKIINVGKSKKHDIDLNEQLDKAYCVVADTSSVSAIALIRGIPVISSSEGPVGQISESSLDNINELKFNDKRKEMINQLTHYSFTSEQLISGYFYKHLIEFNLLDT